MDQFSINIHGQSFAFRNQPATHGISQNVSGIFSSPLSCRAQPVFKKLALPFDAVLNLRCIASMRRTILGIPCSRPKLTEHMDMVGHEQERRRIPFVFFVVNTRRDKKHFANRLDAKSIGSPLRATNRDEIVAGFRINPRGNLV